MTREDKTRLGLHNFVSTLEDAVTARTHLHREWALKWVLAPILYISIIPCVTLLVLDALHLIPPMRSELISAFKTILGIGAGGTTVGAGFGWLFDRKIDSEE